MNKRLFRSSRILWKTMRSGTRGGQESLCTMQRERSSMNELGMLEHCLHIKLVDTCSTLSTESETCVCRSPWTCLTSSVPHWTIVRKTHMIHSTSLDHCS